MQSTDSFPSPYKYPKLGALYPYRTMSFFNLIIPILSDRLFGARDSEITNYPCSLILLLRT
uniref:Uncharacterized protein n=1 Tax=Utricularia reniformis TaxID=192314 RepID=A0A1Y0B4J9_9LAMI|nr:hypothetical protein AEK19_MT2195 [Utricularia reniformis]ART32342.1 hypothetical protein AEK19_MT2195 [Utricularia reniformis]